jgi:hypothetical protein
MKITGIVTKVSPNYPYNVEVGAFHFRSAFQFKVGQKVKLEFDGDAFDAPWPRGFIVCSPNGLSEYRINDADLALMRGDSVARHWSHIPTWLHDVILKGKKLEWTNVESFYEYHYSAEYDPKRKVLITNYAIR